MQVGFMCQHVVSWKLRNGSGVKLAWPVHSTRCSCTWLFICVGVQWHCFAWSSDQFTDPLTPSKVQHMWYKIRIIFRAATPYGILNWTSIIFHLKYKDLKVTISDTGLCLNLQVALSNKHVNLVCKVWYVSVSTVDKISRLQLQNKRVFVTL